MAWPLWLHVIQMALIGVFLGSLMCAFLFYEAENKTGHRSGRRSVFFFNTSIAAITFVFALNWASLDKVLLNGYDYCSQFL